MKSPRISIAGLMAAVALFAVSWAVISSGLGFSRWVRAHDVSLYYFTIPDRRTLPKNQPVYAEHNAFVDSTRIASGWDKLLVGVTPMAGLLALIVGMMIRDLATRGRCSPFRLGFVACGSMATLCYAAFCVFRTGWADEYIETIDWCVFFVVGPIVRLFSSAELVMAIGVILYTLALFLPLVVVGLVGGRLNERIFRIALVIEPRAETGPAGVVPPDPG